MPLGRVKVWGEEVLLYTDLNNEFNNLCNNVVVEPVTFTQTVDLNGKTLILDDDGNTSLDATVNDTIDITIAGADDFRLTPNTFTLLNGSTLVCADTSTIDLDGNNLILDDDADLTFNSSTDDVATLKAIDTRTNTVAVPLVVEAQTTGSPAANIGTGIRFDAESGDEAPSQFGQLEFAASDVNAGSEDTYFQVLLRVAGAVLSAAYRFAATTANRCIQTHANTADRTYNWPDLGSFGDVVGTTATQTISNKTFAPSTNAVIVQDRDVSTTTVTNSATETTCFTGTIPGGTLGTNRAIRVTLIGTVQQTGGGVASTWTTRVKYGGTTFVTLAGQASGSSMTGLASYHVDAVIAANNSATVQVARGTLVVGTDAGAGASDVVFAHRASYHNSGAVSSGSDQTLAVTVQSDNVSAGNTINVYTVHVEILGT